MRRGLLLLTGLSICGCDALLGAADRAEFPEDEAAAEGEGAEEEEPNQGDDDGGGGSQGEGEGEPSGEGEAEPSGEGEAEPSGEGEADPSGEGEGEPSGEGEGEPSGEGEGEPSGEGEGEPSGEGEGEPTGEGEGEGEGEGGDPLACEDGDIGPLCEEHRVCAGARKPCVLGRFEICEAGMYDDWQAEETACDCLDNDCDGLVDEGEDGQGCSLAEIIAEVGADLSGRRCVVRASGEIAQGTYRFGSVVIEEGVTVTVAPGAASPARCGVFGGHGGYPGRLMHLDQQCVLFNGGGCLRLEAQETVDVQGIIRADGQASVGVHGCDGQNSGAGSAGHIDLVGDEVVLGAGGRLQVHGGAGYSVGRNEQYSSGGGAGGTVHLVGRRVVLDGSVTSRGGGVGGAYVGAEPVRIAGGGAGGPGGEGRAAGAGGGSGGPGLDVGRSMTFYSAGRADPQAALTVVGGLIVGEFGSMGTYHGGGAGGTGGHGRVRLQGQAAAASGTPHSGEEQLSRFAVRLTNGAGTPVVEPWRVGRAGFDPAAEGQTEAHGWGFGDPTFSRGAQYRLFTPAAAQGTQALVSYGDPVTGGGCTVTFEAVPGGDGVALPDECMQ